MTTTTTHPDGPLLEELKSLGTRLTEGLDEQAGRIAAIEEALQDLDLGDATFLIPLTFGTDQDGNPIHQHERSTWVLGFDRLKSTLRVAVAKGTVHEHHSPQCLVEAHRELRIAANPHLTALLEGLRREASEQIEGLDDT